MTSALGCHNQRNVSRQRCECGHLRDAAGRLAICQRRCDVAARHVARAALCKLRVVHACARAHSALQAPPAAPCTQVRRRAWLAYILIAPPRLNPADARRLTTSPATMCMSIKRALAASPATRSLTATVMRHIRFNVQCRHLVHRQRACTRRHGAAQTWRRRRPPQLPRARCA